MSRIFVSYAREDRPALRALEEGLRQTDHELWWDARLEAGEDFRSKIEHELNSADVVLVVWSKRSRNSRWVLEEAERGVQRGVLLPVRIDDLQLPLGFGGFNIIDFSSWSGGFTAACWRDLLAEIDRLSGERHVAGVRPPIRVLKPALLLTLGWGTGIALLLSLLGNAVRDSLIVSVGVVPIAFWSALEVKRAGFEKWVVILKRMLRWFLVGSLVALAIIVIAAATGNVAAQSPRGKVLELLGVFVVITTATAFILTAWNLVRFSVRRTLGQGTE